MEQLSHMSLASVLLATLVSGQATQIVSSVSSSAPQVDLGYVKYQGYENSTAGIKYFRGLQYASDHSHTKVPKLMAIKICRRPVRAAALAKAETNRNLQYIRHQ